MNDLAFVTIMVAFFALAALFVAACDRIVGPDDQTLTPSSAPEPHKESVAA